MLLKMIPFLGAFAAATLLFLPLTFASETPGECMGLSETCSPYLPAHLQIMDRDTQHQVVNDVMDGSAHQITEAELRGFCRVYVDTYACYANHTVRCIPPQMKSLLQGVVSRTLALTGVCNRPDFFTKAQILLGCVQSTLRVYRKYTPEERRSFARQNEKCDRDLSDAPRVLGPYLEPVSREPGSRGTELLVFRNESTLLTGVCCQLKKIVSCLPRVSLIRQECTFEAVDLGRTILKGLFDHYQCPNILELAANVCPNPEELFGQRPRH